MTINSISPTCSGSQRVAKMAAAIAVAALVALTGAVRTAAAQSAKRDYDENCAGCHGLKGKGNGTATAVMPATPMPDITQLAKKNGGRFPFESVVEAIDGRKNIPSHARIEMPFWGVTMQKPGAEFSPKSDAAVKQRIDALAHYIETLQQH
jgi:mono/diheme cytochrome c family protein